MISSVEEARSVVSRMTKKPVERPELVPARARTHGVPYLPERRAWSLYLPHAYRPYRIVEVEGEGAPGKVLSEDGYSLYCHCTQGRITRGYCTHVRTAARLLGGRDRIAEQWAGEGEEGSADAAE